MQWVLLAVLILIFCFGFVVFFGAPYLPTLNPQARVAIELINLKPGDTMLELGCGDGKILALIAKSGVYAVGYELNPILVVIARLRTWRYRKYARVIWGDFWRKQWPDADGIFVFILQKHMEKLNKKIIQWHDGKSKRLKLVSFAFKVPDMEPVKYSKGVYLYEYK